MLGTPERGPKRNRSEYWALMSSFVEGSSSPEITAPEQPEPERNSPIEAKRATGDFMALGDDLSQLPDWRSPVHVKPEVTAFREYAATRSMPRDTAKS
jgi:hypothetical protein